MDQKPQAHPEKSQLHAFVVGKLELQQIDELEKHLSSCEACSQTVQQIQDDTFVGLVRQSRAVTSENADSAQPALESRADTIAVPDSQIDKDNNPSVDLAKLDPNLADHPRYRVLELLGAGGMGAVYKAEHKMMQRTVALKIIDPKLIAEKSAVERFHREVQAAARLHHPNIVTAHDAEQAGDVHFLVMEYVVGTDLHETVKERGPLPIAEACEYIRQAALGLQHAHEQGMVHRDIKPQNLMLSVVSSPWSVAKERKGESPRTTDHEPRTVKILDFGLASLTANPQSAIPNPQSDESEIRNPKSEITQSGTIMGTPDYMSPEQANDASSADIRADIYSLGCTLHYLLTAQVPFPEGSAIDKIKAQATREPEAIGNLRADVPQEVGRILEKMMAKDKEERFQTPAKVAEALEPFAKQALPQAQQKGRWPLIAAGTALLAVAAALIFWLSGGVTLFLPTPHGTVKIEIKDPKIKVRFAEKTITFENAGAAITITPGKHSLSVERGDLKFQTPKFTLGRGENPALRVEFLKGQVVVRQGGNELAKQPVAADSDGWVQLFNGKDLTGWKTHPKHPGNWRVDGNGHLVGTTGGKGSHLYYAAKKFDNFHLRVETKLNSGGDSGICFRCDLGNLLHVKSAIDWQPVGYEVQMGYRSFGQIIALANGKRPAFLGKGVSVVADSWFLLEVIAEGNRLTTKINGTVISKVISNSHQAGWIALQHARAHATVVHFKKIEIKELSEKSPAKDEITLVRKLTGHSGPVRAMASAPNGQFVLSGGMSGAILLWDTKTWQRIDKIDHAFAAGVTSLAISANSRYAIAGRAKGHVHLWEIQTGKVLHWLKGHTKEVTGIAFSPDGKYAVSSAEDELVILWDIMTGKEIKRIPVKDSFQANCVAFVPDGRHILCGGRGGFLKLWDIKSDKVVSVRSHRKAIETIVLSPNGQYALTGSWDKTIRLWDVATMRPIRTFNGHTHIVESLAIAGNGQNFVSGSSDKTLRVWDVQTGRELSRIQLKTAFAMRVCLTADGRFVVSGGGSGKRSATPDHDFDVRVWQLPEKVLPKQKPKDEITLVRKFKGHETPIRGVAISADGHTLISGNSNGVGKTRLYDIMSGKQLPHQFGNHQIAALKLSPSGKTLAIAHLEKERKGEVSLWDYAARKKLPPLLRGGHTHIVEALAFSPNEKLLFTGSPDKTICMWNTQTGEKLAKIDTGIVIKALRVTADGKRLLYGTYQHLIVWDIESRKEQKRIKGPFGTVCSLDLCKDENTVVTGKQGDVVLWDLNQGAVISSWKPHSGLVTGAAFTSDGRHIITTAQDRTIKIWRTGDLKLAASHKAKSLCTSLMVITPDGRHIITGGGAAVNLGADDILDGDYALRLWQLPKSVWPTKTTRAVLLLKKGGPNLKMILDGREFLLAGKVVKEIAKRAKANPKLELHLQGDVDLEDQLTRDLLGLIQKAGVQRIVFPPAMKKKMQEAARRVQLMNNLKQVGVALHSYHDAHRSFPPAQSLPAGQFGKDGKPLLSWRVHLLPFLEQDNLYKQFRLDEPWDSKHNIKLLAKMPPLFKTTDDDTKTPILAVVGKGTAYEGKRGVTFKDIKDPKNTIYAVIAGADKAVPWTKPADLQFDPKAPARMLGKIGGDAFLALFCDTGVRQVRVDQRPHSLRALFTRDESNSRK